MFENELELAPRRHAELLRQAERLRAVGYRKERRPVRALLVAALRALADRLDSRVPRPRVGPPARPAGAPAAGGGRA